jgi:ABC-type cobalamin/Fe3+-siderophores transport system ATPase subunit
MIDIKGLTFSYSNEPLIENFSAQIHLGQSVLLTGRNGAGKSTLLSLIAGSLQPQAGLITMSGSNVAKKSAKELALLRSVAPQRRTFALAFTVADTLNFIPAKRQSPMKALIIEKLGLEELLPKKVTELSLGQQQRVSVALALIQDADFYLLDEPFSAQDTQSEKLILEIIRALTALKRGVLVISHNADALHSSFDTELKI